MPVPAPCPSPFESRAGARSRLVPPGASHEQQPPWKRKLQAKIDEHNRKHGRKPKGVSNKTMHERASSLFRSFGLLRRLGFQIDPDHLAGRHIQALVDYWTCNARVADRCGQHGVAMLERAHSAAYIQQQLSFLRVYADSWIAKPGMVHPLASYVDEPARFRRSGVATEDRSWDGNAVEFKRIVEKVAAIDARVAAQLALLLAFGLRRKEAVMFKPHVAVVSRHDVPASQHVSERYAAILRIERGTKGGRLRLVEIRNDEQRLALERVLPFAPHASSHLGHPGISLKQCLKRFDNVMRKAGVTRRQLGVTAHGLRHQFAQEFHVELTDVRAPIRGGDACADAATLNAALLEIARQLGHNRPAITCAYLGSLVRPSHSIVPAGTGKEAQA
jgi:integrase